ncbi:hypothetical protein V8D89_007815 [Ganoderma adspersum]
MLSEGSSGLPNVHRLGEPLKIDPDGCHSDRLGYHPPFTESSDDSDPAVAAKTAGSNIPDTGWVGQIPSRRGGDLEPNFMSKPPYSWNSIQFKRKHHLRCWCGNIEFEFHGDPVDAKYCHCKQCQHLHGAPFQWAVIFPKTSVRMISNKYDSLRFFSTKRSQSVHDVPCKVSCNVCRSPLFDEGRNTVLAYPSAFEFPGSKVPASFRPTAHIFYSQRVMDIPDGVPKWSRHKNESALLPECTIKEGAIV